MEDRSSYVLKFIQEQQQLMVDIDEEFQAVTKRLTQFDHEKIDAESEKQRLQIQLNNQQQSLTKLVEQVELTRTQLKQICDAYEKQQETVIEIAIHQREIPAMELRITELETALQEHQNFQGIQIEDRTAQLNSEIEQTKQSHKETFDRKSKQLERDLKALRLILAQENDSSFIDNLRQKHQDELEQLRVELQQQIENEKANIHNKCHSNVENLKKRLKR